MSEVDTEGAGLLSRVPALDVLFGSVGLGAGLVSLTFPLGRDQGVSFYVAREWVLRGAIPYRDSFTDKAPGISIVHAAAIAVFGERSSGIRFADFACVVALGLLAALLATPRGLPVRPGLRGVGVLFACVLYFGFHDFWDTAQPESWFSMLAIASVTAARRIDSAERAAALSGLAMGAALLMKAPAACFVPVALAVVATRLEGGENRGVRGLKLFGAWSLGVALLPAVVVAYFSMRGALSPMLEIFGGVNREDSGVVGASGFALAILAGLWVYNPMSTVFLGWIAYRLLGAGRNANRRRFEDALLALGLGLAGLAAILVQRKFYPFHWVALVGPSAAIATMMAVDARDAIARRAPTLLPTNASLAAIVVVFLAGYACSGSAVSGWLKEHRALFAHRRGELSTEAFAATFSVPAIAFNYAESEEVGLWLRAHTRPEELVAVRGFEPEIYAVAGRRYPGRFFWTVFLVGGRSVHERQWLEEDARALAANPPAYVVTIRGPAEPVDSSRSFAPLGYHVVKEFRAFEVLAR